MTAPQMLLVMVAMAHIISLLAPVNAEASTNSYSEEAMKARHESWMEEHGRTYEDDDEKALRLQVFKVNANFIDMTNAAGDKAYRLGTTKFADMTTEEFLATNTGLKPPVVSSTQKVSGFKYENSTLSGDLREIDWRKKGAVTGVKNTGRCGACWAFSAVAAVEGIHQITTGNLVALSEQQLIDCSIGSNEGCHGGLPDSAFQYIIDNDGITAERDYPYTAAQGMCTNISTAVYWAAKISGYQDIPSGDEVALEQAVSNQPVSVGIEAISRSIQSYVSGVITADSCGKDINHAMTVVGYGTADDKRSYWLIKNNWGKSWGEGGYMRLEKGNNACGIATLASYPVA